MYRNVYFATDTTTDDYRFSSFRSLSIICFQRPPIKVAPHIPTGRHFYWLFTIYNLYFQNAVSTAPRSSIQIPVPALTAPLGAPSHQPPATAPSGAPRSQSRPRCPADWYLPAFHSLIILTAHILHRMHESAKVGPRRTMVSFIGTLTLVHPFATTWHFPSRGNEKFRGAFRLSADRPRMTVDGGCASS